MDAEDHLKRLAVRLSICKNPEDGEEWLYVESRGAGEDEPKHTFCKTALWLAKEVKNWHEKQQQQQPPPPPTHPYACSSQQPPPQILLQSPPGVGVLGQHSHKDPYMCEWSTFSNEPYMGVQITHYNEIYPLFQQLFGVPPSQLQTVWQLTRDRGYRWYTKVGTRADRHAIVSVCSCCEPRKDQTNIGRSHSFVFWQNRWTKSLKSSWTQ